ncbi:MAG: DUF4339 domain-containing protein [Verrucomicrobiota bacterium]
MWLYLIKNSEKQGPFSVDELQARVTNGSVKKTDLVWREGESGYLPAAAFLSNQPTGSPVSPRSDLGYLSKASIPGGPEPDYEGLPAEHPVLERPLQGEHPRSEPFDPSGSVTPPAGRSNQWDAVARDLSHLRGMPLRGILPIEALIHGELWKQLGIVWVLVLAAIPLALGCLPNQGEEGSVLLTGAYFALLMAFASFFLLRPDRPHMRNVLLFVAIPFVLITAETALLNRMGVSRFLPSVARFLLSYMLISLPFVLVYVRKRRVDSFRTIVFFGCLAGLAYGLMHFSPNENAYSDRSLVVWRILARLLICSTDAGILACFIALAAQNRRISLSLTVLGIAIATILDTLSSYFIGSLSGCVVAVFSLLLLAAYVRGSADLQKQLDAMPVRRTGTATSQPRIP